MKITGRNKAYDKKPISENKRIPPDYPCYIKVPTDEEFIAREKEKMRKLKEALRKPSVSIVSEKSE